MHSRAGLRVALVAGHVLSGASMAWAWQAPKAAGSYRPTRAERTEIASWTAELSAALEGLRGKVGEGSGGRDAVADVEVCHKAATWVVRFDEFREAGDVARTLKVVARGLERARALSQGRTPWAEAAGGVVRGYRSKVDGSVQPYAVIVPAGRGPDDRLRLDVVLHGRDARLTEVRFFDAHDGKPATADGPGLVLHVFGRTNNAYRWAGEADVFEAIDAVKRNYRVADRRVVLRGFSMGGAGAWHLGLHHPGRWSSVEAGAGFTETIRYARLGDPSEVVRKGLRIYDAVDYAVNAFDVPIVGYGGEVDPQIQASKNIEAALVALGVPMKAEGLVTKAEGPDFLRVVGKGMGHAVDKDSSALMKAFHDERAVKGSDPYPRKIRFATYTLKYNRAGWVTIERLAEHYRRATIEAEIQGDVAAVRTENVEVIAVARQAGETLRLDGQEFPLREAVRGLLPDVYFRKSPKGWELLDHDGSLAVEENARGEKHPGLQGPIDDGFTGPFLCVRGTGKPEHPQVHAWADARLRRFADDWARSLRGDLRIKDDVDVTAQDIEENHLILFGDPGSNRLIARVLPGLPMAWTPAEVVLDGKFSAADHSPVLINANPLNRLRYVVINGGHTFGAKEFSGTNALLYPHLGDFAVIKIGEDSADEVKAGGYFDERWKMP
jgi:dienelactone hydrolase